MHFSEYPIDYWIAGYLLSGMLIISAVYKKIPFYLFLVVGMAVLLIKRLPVVFFNRELNPDESFMLTNAMTLFRDPMYLRSVDGQTIGPLDNYILVIPRLLGYQIDYTSGRVIGLVCISGAMLFLFLSIRNWFGENTARIMILIPLLFLSFTQEPDFVHYSSEQLPLFLLAGQFWLLTKLSNSTTKTTHNLYFYLLGLIAGTIPFAKLQAVPQAMIITLACVYISYQLIRKENRYGPGLWTFAGIFTVPTVVFLWALSHRLLNEAIDFYLFANIIYATAKEQSTGLYSQFFRILELSPDFKAFAWVLLIQLVIGVVTLRKQNRQFGFRVNYLIIFTLLGLTISGVYAVTKSGNAFTHYLNFCIIPFALLTAYGSQKNGKWNLVFPIFLLGWFCYQDTASYSENYSINHFVTDETTTNLQQSPVVRELKKYTKPDDYMVVWGWQCTYYVEAQLAQGTAENHSERSVFKNAMLNKYRSRYLAGVQRTKPAVFLDAVGENSLWLKDKKTQGHRSFPVLARYVDANYTFMGNFGGTALYVRKDRI